MALPAETERDILADVNVNKVLNVTEHMTLASIRDGQHKDVHGNVIGMHRSLQYSHQLADCGSQSTPTSPTLPDHALRDP